MNTIRHILFPYDFSEQCNQAIPFVSALASKLNATITVLHAVPWLWTPPPAGMTPIAVPASPEMEMEADAQLEEAIRKRMLGVAFDHVVVGGDAAIKIVEYAEKHRIDLIVMPTHGRGTFRALLLGSVTSKVLHDAKCAVWTATHKEEQRSKHLPKTVLCAIDGGAQTAELLRNSMCFAAKLGAELKVLHVVPPISDWLDLPSEREIQEQMRDAAREQLHTILAANGINLPVRIAVGPITGTVVEEARQEGADLVIIGRGAASENLGRLKTHTYGIIQKSPCPVLSI